MSLAVRADCDAAAARASTQTSRPGHPRYVLAATILASSLAFVDGSVVNVGLPAIGHSLGVDAGALQWVVNGYLLPLSALLLLGGAAGDRFGRRRLLIAGIGLFALASLACACAPGLQVLLLGRLMQGAGAAMLMPNSLAILGQTFSGEDKGRAIGIWAATGAIAGAAGPVLGGWLIDTGGWRDIFLINLPLAAAAIYLAWRYVPNDPDGGGQPLDMLGGTLVTIGLGVLTWALTVGSGSSGWTTGSVAAAVFAVGILAAFVLAEKHLGERAMMPLTLFTSRTFIGLTLLTLFLYGALSGLLVLLPYVLIKAGAYSATAAGATLLPFPAVLAIASPFLGSLAGRVGARLPLTIGPVIVAGGFLLALRIGRETSYWTGPLPAILVIAFGMSFAVAPLTTAVLSSVDAQHTGSASGFNSAIARSGGLIATALLGSVLASKSNHLVAAFHVAMIAGAITCVVASVCAFALIARGTGQAGR
jgi:EmrB/QacA subfamily drug resistance transporter